MSYFEYIIIFTSCFLILGQTKEIKNISEYDENSRFFLFPDGDKKMHVVDKYDLNMRSIWFKPEEDVLYLLYTKKNSVTPYHLQKGNKTNLLNSNYNLSNPTKIIVHGWKSSHKSEFITLLVSAYLSTIDANIIVVDWSAGSSNQYLMAVLYAPSVGRELAKFIDWLVNVNTLLKDIHLLGHSLGAHIVGNAGRNVHSGKIPYITVFDPAGPLWNNDSERIRPTDAEYVEAIHTSGGFAGLLDTVGDVDFFPNGGRWMPGCGMDIACSHSRSYEYFTETISSITHIGIKCTSFVDLLDGNCTSHESLPMGGEIPKSSHGIFYLKTKNKKPFYT